MMTEDDIPAEILRLLPEVRKTHPGIANGYRAAITLMLHMAEPMILGL